MFIFFSVLFFIFQSISVEFADKLFTDALLSNGVRSAYLEFISENSHSLKPNIFSTYITYSKHRDNEKVLRRYPISTYTSDSGDMGFSSGYTQMETYLGKDKDTLSKSFYYLLIWEKIKGNWKIVFDTSVKSDEVKTSYQNLIRKNNKPNMSIKAFIQNINTKNYNYSDNLIKFADDDIRYYRDGVIPVIGKDSVIEFAEKRKEKVIKEFSSFSKESDGGDFAYSYGTGLLIRNDIEYHYSFVRVWRLNKKGDWNILVDLTNEYQL